MFLKKKIENRCEIDKVFHTAQKNKDTAILNINEGHDESYNR